MLYYDTLFFITNIVVKARNGFSVVIFVFMSKVLFFLLWKVIFRLGLYVSGKIKKIPIRKIKLKDVAKCLVRNGGCFFFLAAVALIA